MLPPPLAALAPPPPPIAGLAAGLLAAGAGLGAGDLLGIPDIDLGAPIPVCLAGLPPLPTSSPPLMPMAS